MSYLTEKFVRLAVREDESPDRAGGVQELAACRCIGAIAQVANNRDDFVKAGLIFLDGFEEMAQEAIDDLSHDDGNKEIILEIKGLIAEASEVNRNEFRACLAEAWGNSHDEEDLGIEE